MTHNHEQVMEEFFSGFAAGNSITMASCYHAEMIFEDPIFGRLEASDAIAMWEMLLEKSHGLLDIKFSNVICKGNTGSTDWTADYIFASTGNRVINRVHAEFEFKDGLIYRHTDFFDFYKWSKQALGLKGILFGWTPFLQRKIQYKALESLRSFQQKHK